MSFDYEKAEKKADEVVGSVWEWMATHPAWRGAMIAIVATTLFFVLF